MPFRQGRFSLLTRNGILKAFGAVSVGLAGASVANAATTVTPVRSDGTTLLNVASSTAYYPVSPLTAAGDGTYFLDTGDTSVPERIYDVTAGQTEATFGENMLRFSFFSDKAVTQPSGGSIVVVATVNGSAGIKYIPIASITGSSSCSNCQGVIASGVTNYYGAARYTPGAPMQIGIYPADICTIYNAQSGSGNAYGCTAGNVVDTATAPTSTMTLSLYVTTVANQSDLPTAVTSASSLGAADATLSLRFEASDPTLNCASMTNIYFPGDSQIFLNATGFSLSGGVAPIFKIIALGNDGSAAVPTSAFASANVVNDRVNTGPEEVVDGFTNTTDGTDHQYQLAFMARDLAGIVAIDNACTLSPVQTSEVEGFLRRSGCFIATAAFRSDDAPPVEMLRQFRDRVLLKFELGRTFVDFYYSWSPGAAEWLMRHPVFRLPVLLALTPVQAIAWLALHPGWFAFLILGNILILPKGFRDETAR